MSNSGAACQARGTAIKTALHEYRDAWAIAFRLPTYHCRVDGQSRWIAMDGVTGAVGPAMVLRSLFSEINPQSRHAAACASAAIWFPPKICRQMGRLPTRLANPRTENSCRVPCRRPRAISKPLQHPQYRLFSPPRDCSGARPRIPGEFEALPMQIAPVPGFQRVDWYVDGKLAAGTTALTTRGRYKRGTHSVRR